jgi:hypothetical protein
MASPVPWQRTDTVLRSQPIDRKIITTASILQLRRLIPGRMKKLRCSFVRSAILSAVSGPESTQQLVDRRPLAPGRIIARVELAAVNCQKKWKKRFAPHNR